MRSAILATAAVAALLASAAIAQPSHDMSKMQAGMPPMPSLYAGQADKPGAPVFTGLGSHHFPITTANPETQKFFDQGVKLSFGFNHAEAIRSFREAARLDPDCAMCWWGVAYALGSNINMPMPDDAVAPAWAALRKAQALASKASPREQAWIAALATRYSADRKANRPVLNAAYAEAMGKVWRDYPDDLDAATFYAEAMMDTQPWAYWEADGVTPKGHGAEIVSTLETVIRRAPEHPGALHLYIHAVEASTTPERAESAADKLLVLMPQAGHIVHMPSHIYYRVGRYADAAKANELAATVDEAYIAACKAQGFYPAGYYGHNIHFLWTSSEMQGRYKASLDAARRLVTAVDAVNQAKQLPVAELYVFTPVVTLVRFGRWQEVLAEPAPDKALVLDTAMWLYAQGFAHANTGDLAAARADQKKLAALAKGKFTRYDDAGVPAQQMVALANVVLSAEIARTSGDLDGAIAQFRMAQTLEDQLPYTEPAYWHRPTSHLLGAALMQANRPAEAEAVYKKSLANYRLDGWALYGLAKALEAQGKTDEMRRAQNAFMEAWRAADTRIQGSRL
ncbi:MAG: hypothetical protein ABW360_09855 [Phenylobacterium sp.]